MNRKTKKCNKPLTRTFKNKPPNVKRRRPQHGGAFHVDLIWAMIDAQLTAIAIK